MKTGVLRGNGLKKNIIFDRSHPANRDDCFAPYAGLKQEFHRRGIDINTVDEANGAALDFELHQDVQPTSDAAIAYLLMFETEFVKPENGDAQQWEKYRKIFTWNDTLVDGKRFIKMNFPNPLAAYPADGFSHRERFCCLISGNRTLDSHDERILYPERVNAIRWFENHAPDDFDLFGVGWDMPVVHSGWTGKVERRLWKLLKQVITLRPFPSYRGKVAHKRDVLQHTRFAICYENVRDFKGYITEKIFDCFFSGCVPVYWGADNIHDYVPANCFVDRRKFKHTSDVYAFLKSMPEVDFIAYQQNMAEYLNSKAAYPFGSEYFAETVVNAIVTDLEI